LVIALFKAVNVSKFFGTTIALDNISLEFSRGLNILLGPNGSGKSTLLKLWSGLLRPSKGKVFVYDLDPWRHRKHIMEKLPSSSRIYLLPGGLVERNL